MKSSSSDSIGIFDSGFGGLSVMREIRAALPHENITYLGDTARLPYGNKSAKKIVEYTLESVDFLNRQGVKIIIIACNTACSFALEAAQKASPIPVFGVILPGVESIVQMSASKMPRIAIIGTRGTIESGIYKKKIQALLPAVYCTSLACPLFVPLVEEGYSDHPLTEMAVREYLHPLKEERIDTVLLACTHYPLLRAVIQKEMGSHVTLIDPAKGCAKNVKAFLTQHTLLTPQCTAPRDQFFVTDDPEKFRLLGKTFLHSALDHVVDTTL